MPHANYLVRAFTDHKKVVEQSYALLKKPLHKFDAIAVRGVSGLIIGAPLAYLLNKPLIVVRKPYEVKDGNSHSLILVESNYSDTSRFSWIFLDDCIGGGSTRKFVKEGVEKLHPFSTYVMSFLWAQGAAPDWDTR